MAFITRLYGRHLADFHVGQTYAHPWEVTLDAGTVALHQAAFLDACPVFASQDYARALGFRERPVSPLLLLNLVLSFSVHDISEQCIAHLAYVRVLFPRAVCAGTTVRAASTCLEVSETKSQGRGVVHVRTVLLDGSDDVVCLLERKALVPSGQLAQGVIDPYPDQAAVPESCDTLPLELTPLPRPPVRSFGFGGFYEDFAVGDVLCHGLGKTVSEGEHMMLTSLVRNTHPLHFNADYAAHGGSFTGRPVVMGGLVLNWAVSLASRDLSGNAVWELGFAEGAHPAPVHAGDTLYAASKVLAHEPIDARWGKLTLRLVAVKNTRPDTLLAAGHDLFAPELTKPKEARVADKVLEITRTLLVRRRPAGVSLPPGPR